MKAIEIFIAVCAEKNFSKVAQQFELSATMISKYVNFLEKEANVKLLNRSTRGQKLTEAGQLYLLDAQKILEQHQQLMQRMEDFSKVPQGLIKINAPVTFGTYQLTHLISIFMGMHPDIRIELNLSDTLSDVILDEFDVVFRVGALRDASYISQKVAEQQLVFCASAKYIEEYGIPTSLKNLEDHHCLGFKPWNTNSNLKQEFEMDHLHLHESKFVSNNGNCLRVAASQGIGIVLQSLSLLQENIDNGSLIKILEDDQPKARPIHMLYPVKKKLPLKVRLFIDFISTYGKAVK